MKVKTINKLDFELYNDIQKRFIESTQIFNVYEVIYTYKTMRGNKKTNRKFVISKEESEVWNIFCDYICEYNSKNPKKAERFIELDFIKSIGIYKANAFELGVINPKQIELNDCSSNDLLDVWDEEDFYTDFKRKLIKPKIDLKLYEIIYSYETRRKNKKQSKKYAIAKDFLEVIDVFLEDIISFNEKKDYRAISNVQILDIVVKKAVTN